MIESRESARGCGYRKVGGLYLVSDAIGAACGRMPIPLCVCPTCGAGIKPARGWTWIDGDALTAEAKTKDCPNVKPGDFCGCPMDRDYSFGRAGLIWIGESFYATPGDFQREAARMGISRRIAAVPRGFEIGKTFVFLAHRFAVPDVSIEGDPEFKPGVFSIFRPTRIEVICDGTETPEQIIDYEGRGLTPVKVIRIGEDENLFPSEASDEDSN
jgi:hypothetical protein